MSKLIKGSLILAALLVFSAVIQAAPADICADDEEVLLAVPGNEVMLYYAYDSQGNRIGRVPVLGWGDNAKLVRKNALFLADKDDYTLLRAEDLQPAAFYPSSEYHVNLLGSHYIVLEKSTGVLTLYDESTEPLGKATVDNNYKECTNLSAEILELSDSFIIKLSDYETNEWIRFDGEQGYQIRDPGMLQYLDRDDMDVFSLGQYIAVCPFRYAAKEGVRGVIMTPDGTVVMDGIETMLTESFSTVDAIYLTYGYDKTRTMAYVAVRDVNGKHMLVDTSLEYLGSLDEKPNAYDSYGDGFVKGLEYPELQGYCCKDFVIDVDNQTNAPYAETWDSLLIWKDGRCLEIQAEGTPIMISSAYLVTTFTDSEDNDHTNVYRTKDGSLMASYSRFYRACLSLGSQGIALHDDQDTDNWWQGTATIYDNEGNPTYHSSGCRLYAFVNGTWSCQRGVYRGLIDMNGKWVVKDMYSWEI